MGKKVSIALLGLSHKCLALTEFAIYRDDYGHFYTIYGLVGAWHFVLGQLFLYIPAILEIIWDRQMNYLYLLFQVYSIMFE
jgi:hypothetical protein